MQVTTETQVAREIVAYELRDTHTKSVIKTYSVAQRKSARNRAEKLNLQYGAHRYSAQPVFSNDANAGRCLVSLSITSPQTIFESQVLLQVKQAIAAAKGEVQS